MALPGWLSEADDGALVSVRLQPRASTNRITGAREAALVVHVTAPPVEGRANKALCRLIAKAVGVAPSRVEVVRGASAREKVVRVRDVAAADLPARLLP